MPLANAERQARYRRRAAAALRLVKNLGLERNPLQMPKFIEVGKDDFVNLDLVARICQGQVGKGYTGNTFIFVAADGTVIASAVRSFNPRLIEGLIIEVKAPRSDTAPEPAAAPLAVDPKKSA